MSNLTKNKAGGMIFGVCRGISDYTGIDVTIVRLLTVFGAIVSGSIIFWVYLLLGILLPNKEK
jgi:phage shock protein C